ncbi:MULTISPECIES: hypothetical protein [unclassified Streptomyces]|uniref:hypothetical protein n=1 Tax=unclassified Streptomyces TaxID=2593676 RepID=UPI001F072AB9|nr:hypothetical protein [Streptomyces sp. CB09001]
MTTSKPAAPAGGAVPAPTGGAAPARPGPPDATGSRHAVAPAAGPARPDAGRPVEWPASGLGGGPGEDWTVPSVDRPEGGGPARPATQRQRPDGAAERTEDRAERPSTGPAADGQARSADGQGRFGSGRSSAGPVTDGHGRSADGRATVRLRGAPAREHPDEPPRYAPEWLRLREPADAAARAHDLLDPLRIRLANLPGRADGLVVHDLGCGTGSMGRWLAPLLDGAQHWVLHDRDPYLLHFAAVAAPRTAADGSRVTVETRRGDLARLTPDALTGAALVTASALLDVLTTEEVGRLAAACTAAGCPALLTLSVAGRVDLTPIHPLDAEITEAFNDHQRRTGMLGPDAVTAAAEAFAGHGATVREHPSDWRLGPDEARLTAQWLRGWVGAAVEQRPELGPRADRYLEERLAACAAGELRVVVHHTDLLALCRPTGGAP